MENENYYQEQIIDKSNTSGSADVNINGSQRPQDPMEIEEAMSVVGEGGIYQKRTLVFLWLMFSFLSYFFFLVPSTTYEPQFICADGSICTETTGGCDEGSVIDGGKSASAVTEFGLYCDKAQIRNVLQSIGMVGAGVGLLIVNMISDNFSRKKSIIGVWGIGAISAIVYGLAPNTVILLISSFGIGFGMNSLLVLFLVHINDLSSLYRVLGITVGYAMSSIGQILIYFIIMITEDWRSQILYFFAIPSAVLCIMAFYFIDDQPRFLILKDKVKCVQVLNKIAKINSRSCFISTNDIAVPKNENLDDTNVAIVNRKYTYADLFRFSSQRRITIPLTCTLFFLSSLYYGTQLSLDNVGYSFQTDSLFIGLSELCGYLASDRVCSRMKRRLWGAITLLITSFFLILDGIFSIPNSCANSDCYQKHLQMVFTCLARFVVSFSFSFVLIQVGEAFPVTLKSIGYGFVTGLSTVGSILSPYLQNLSEYIHISPLYTLAVVGMLSSISALFSKETFKQPDVSDIPELLENNKYTGDNNQADFEVVKEINKGSDNDSLLSEN